MRIVRGSLLLLLPTLALPGCASPPPPSAVNDETEQSLRVDTDPPGAACSLTRAGETLADIPVTPGRATVTRSKHDILVVCHKDGYGTAQQVNASTIRPRPLGYVPAAGGLAGAFVGGFLAGVAESMVASNRQYQLMTQVLLPPVPAGSSPTAAPVAFGCPLAGSVFGNSLGNDFEVQASSGYECRSVVHQTGRQVLGVAALTGLNAPTELREAAVALWPLAPGKSTDVDFPGQGSGAGRMYHEHFAVVGQEQITVAAGAYTVYRIVAEQSAIGHQYRDRETFWWSPDLRWTVKYTHEILGGDTKGKRADWELARVQAPTRSVAAATP
jgi:hypothetical protein